MLLFANEKKTIAKDENVKLKFYSLYVKNVQSLCATKNYSTRQLLAAVFMTGVIHRIEKANNLQIYED
jgi:hypothetical protein